ncbi:MAG: InlB B-repeat-containing protein [Candidatus Saliniplasma sp.]
MKSDKVFSGFLVLLILIMLMGSILMISDEFGAIIEYDTTLDEPTDTLQGNDVCIEENLFAVGSMDNNIYVYNMTEHSLVDTIDTGDDIFDVRFSHDGEFLSVAVRDDVRIYNVSEIGDTPEPYDVLTDATDTIQIIDFSYNSEYMATASYDNDVRIYNVSDLGTTPEPYDTLSDATDSMKSVRFSCDDVYLATTSKDTDVRIYNVSDLGTTPEPYDVLTDATDVLNTATFGYDNEYLISTSNDNDVRIYNVSEIGDTPEPYDVLTDATDSTKVVSFYPNNSRFAVGSVDTDVRIYNVSEIGDTPEPYRVLDEPNGQVMGISITSSNIYVSTNENDGVTYKYIRKNFSIETSHSDDVGPTSANLYGEVSEISGYEEVDVSFEYGELENKFDLSKNEIDTDISEADGQSFADIDADGEKEIVVGTGQEGSVYWYNKTENGWDKHLIYDDGVEIEGTITADFSGDGQMEVIILDQATNSKTDDNIVIANHSGDPTGNWETTVLDSNAYHSHHGIAHDVSGNGSLDIVYAYEGIDNGEGGFYWLENIGGDVSDANNWVKHEIEQIEGAHGVAIETRDYNDDGREDILARVRNGNRSPTDASTELSIYYKPSDAINDDWDKEVLINETDIDCDEIISQSIGDLNNDGIENDILFGTKDSDLNNNAKIYRYDYPFDDNTPEVVVDNENLIYNIQTHDINSDGYDDFVAGIRTGEDNSDSNITIYENVDDNFVEKDRIVMGKPQDRIFFDDIDKNTDDNDFYVGCADIDDTENNGIYYFTTLGDINTSDWDETTPIKITGKGTFNQSISSLNSNSDYGYRVISKNTTTGGIIDEGEILTFKTEATLNIETDIVSSITSSSASLTGEINDMADESSVDAYFDYRKNGTDSWSSTSSQSISSTGEFSIDVSGLDRWTEYEYKAIVDNGTDTTEGSIKTFRTTNDDATVSLSSDTASWTADMIEWSDSVSFDLTVNETTDADITLHNLSSETDYDIDVDGSNWDVKTTDADGDLSFTYSDWSTHTFEVSESITHPSDVEIVNITKNSIEMEWTKGDGGNYTYIERNTTEGWSVGDGTQVYNDTGNSYTDTGLDNNTKYYYQLWAYNETEGEYSADHLEVNATTDEYILTINIEGNGTTDPPEGNHTFQSGEEVAIKAFAEDGWYFEEWSGDYQYSEDELIVTMDDDVSVTAHFEEDDDTGGGGTVPYEEDDDEPSWLLQNWHLIALAVGFLTIIIIVVKGD